MFDNIQSYESVEYVYQSSQQILSSCLHPRNHSERYHVTETSGSGSPYFTFDQLEELNFTAQHLPMWFAPINLDDILKLVSESEAFHNFSYYIHLHCSNNGVDEKECITLELNECEQDKYRCHNALSGGFLLRVAMLILFTIVS